MSREEQEDQGKNLIQMDFCYTYTGEDQRGDEPTLGKVQERQDQFGTCLILTSSETKAIHAVPVPSKGTASLKTITEDTPNLEICATGSKRDGAEDRNPRMTGTGQRASNGQAGASSADGEKVSHAAYGLLQKIELA